jgi:hypothetical protein
MQKPLTQDCPVGQSVVHAVGVADAGTYMPSLVGSFGTGGGGLRGKVQVAAWPVICASAAVSSVVELPR